MPHAPGKSLWKGALSFGIVTIPVAMHAAVREHQLHFHQISRKQHVRIRHQLVAEGSQTVVAPADIVRAFEIKPDEYVPIEEAELKRLAAEKSRTIDIAAFVALAEIDPLYFDASYWLVPEATAARAYGLLHTAMQESGRVAIARFVMRNKEVLAAIRPLSQGLCLDTLHYQDELVDFSTLVGHLPTVKPQAKELDIAGKIIASMATAFEPGQYQDDYRERVLAFLTKKAVGHTEIISEDRERKPGKVLDLMAALEASLGQARSTGAAAASGPSRPARKPIPHRPPTARKAPAARGQRGQRKQAS